MKAKAKQQSNVICTPWQRTSGGLIFVTFLIWNVRYMSNETVEHTIKKLLCRWSSKWRPQFYSEVCGEKRTLCISTVFLRTGLEQAYFWTNSCNLWVCVRKEWNHAAVLAQDWHLFLLLSHQRLMLLWLGNIASSKYRTGLRPGLVSSSMGMIQL